MKTKKEMEERLQLILELIKAGKSYNEIGGQFGIIGERVRQIAVKNGIVWPGNKIRKQKREEIFNSLVNGKTFKEICLAVGYSYKHIQNIVAKSPYRYNYKGLKRNNKKQIIEDFKLGKSIADIAAQTGYSPLYIGNILRKNKVYRVVRTNEWNERMPDIKKMITSGMSARAIGKIYDTSYENMFRFIRSRNL